MLAASVATLLVVTGLLLDANFMRAEHEGGISNPPIAPSVLSPGGDYPTYLGSELRDSASLGAAPVTQATASEIRLLWNFTTGGPVQSQAIEDDGVVYVGAQDGYEYAINAISGALLWKTFLGQDTNDSACDNVLGVTSTATVVGPNLYVDGGYPNFYDLDATTGAIEWSAPVGGNDSVGFYDWSSPLIYQGDAYVGIASDCDHPLVPAGLVEFSLATHDVVNYFNSSVPSGIGSSIWGSPSINPSTNTLFVTTGNQLDGTSPTNYSESIVALNATTLAVQAEWQVPAAAGPGDSDFGVTPTLFTPTGGSPMVTAANKNGLLYAFYQSNLTLAWQQRVCCQISEDDHFSTSWGGGYVYAVGAATSIGGVTFNSSVRAFEPLNGAAVWKDGFSGDSYSGYAAPLYVNGVVVVADGGTLLFLDAQTGKLLSQVNVGGDAQAAASIARGEVFVGSTDGSLLAFDVELTSTASQSVSSGTPPLSVAFNVTVTGGLPPYDFDWTFGDGNNSTLEAPVYQYSQPGTFSVKVLVTDQAGKTSTETLTVTVHGPKTGSAASSLVEDLAVALGVVLVIAVTVAIVASRRRRPEQGPPSGASQTGSEVAGPPPGSAGPGGPPLPPGA